MNVQLTNIDVVLGFWIGITLGGVALAVIFGIISEVIKRDKILPAVAMVIFLVGLVGGVSGVITQGLIAKNQNAQHLTAAIESRYGIHLNSQQQQLLYANGAKNGEANEGKRYGSITISRAHAYLEISLYYIDGKWLLGTAGTGQVHELGSTQAQSI